jgi:hypothetical protein
MSRSAVVHPKLKYKGKIRSIAKEKTLIMVSIFLLGTTLQKQKPCHDSPVVTLY